MNKISDLIKERVFIVNKENLTKEDYERIAEIEIEIREIKKSGKDNKVPTKKTNFEKIKEELTIEDLAQLLYNFNYWAGAECFMDFCFKDKNFSDNCDECPFAHVKNKYRCNREVDIIKFLESEVEE